jgi:hypothetical protein
MAAETLGSDHNSTPPRSAAPDMPMIEPILVEVPNPAHPFGAKGVGEVNIVPPMAAIAKFAPEPTIYRI